MITSFDWIWSAAAPAADAAAAPATAGGDMGTMIFQFVIMAGIVVVFYLLMIRPQRKKDKAVKEMLAALKAGDRVCTIGGIYGTVKSIKDDTVTIEVGAQKTQMVFARWGIRSVEDAPLENDADPAI